MKLILRITKTELATLFFSPIAWFILIVFSFMSGMGFADKYDSMLTSFELGYYGENGGPVSFWIFGGEYGFFASILNNLYMFIPLLTMGLLSREYSSGSIRLLYSSPVTSLQIVFGKYLSTLIYGVVLLGLPILCVVYASIVIPDFDFGMALSGLLGLYLLICAYSAIGLLMSSLTSYQVVAAIATLSALTALNFIGRVGQEYDMVREITYWLSMSGRSAQMLSGLIASEDIIYFVVVVVLFLSLTAMRIHFSRTSIGTVAKTLRYAGVIAMALAIGYVSSRPAMMTFYDATNTKSQTITKNSQDIMSAMDGGMTITHYVNLFDSDASIYLPAQRQNGENVFKQFVRFKPDTKIEYVYYWDSLPGVDIHKMLRIEPDIDPVTFMAGIYRLSPKWFKTPEQIRSMVDLSPFGNRFIRIVERENGQVAYLRDFNDNMRRPGEAEIAAAFKKMITTPAVVGFLGGHGERDINKPGDRDYLLFANDPTFRYALINQGFDTYMFGLDDMEAIPAGINIMVIADPMQPLNENELAILDEYLATGGSMLVLAEPGRGNNLNPLLDRFGVTIENGTIAQPSETFYPDFVLAEITPQAAELSFEFERMAKKQMKVSMPGAAALSYTADSDYIITPLFVTPEKNVWIELETDDMNENMVELNAGVGETEGSYATALALTRQIGDTEQRIIITGDTDALSNAELRMQREDYESGNFDFATESFRWLSHGEFPIDTRRPQSPDNKFSTTVESIPLTKALFMGVYPALLLAAAAAIGLTRRKH